MKNFSLRTGRRRQRGFGIVETVIGLALGLTAVVSGTQFVSHAMNAATVSTVVQDKTTMVTDALNRTSQNIQVSSPILYAAPNELMTKSVDGTGAKVMTRWVKSGTTYYVQSWTGFTGSYMPDPGLWIPVTTAQAAAPNGDGTQMSSALVTDLVPGSAPSIFTYLNAKSAPIDATTAPLTTTAGTTSQIKLINVDLASATVDSAYYENTTSAAPRNSPAGVSDGVVAAPVCPALSFDASSTPTAPVLDWSTVPGAVSYVVYRNSSVAATVTLAAGATKGTWTDTANPAGASTSTTYEVLAKSSSGTLSDSCRPEVWRPQVSQPVLTNSTVLPSGSDASAWAGSPLTSPRITLNWTAVTGASSYELNYRQVDPVTGAALGDGSYKNIQIDGATLTYNWDGGGWGNRYEWYLTADSQSSQSTDSRHIQILTHPGGAGNTAVSAAYNDSTTGKNTLTWTAVSTATGYDVWRYDSGSTGAATLVGSTTSLTFTDTVPYGTNYTYYVAARNTGPRGTDASGNDITGDRSSPPPESPAAQKAITVTQLQYPPIPAMKAASLTTGMSRDYVGYNHIQWDPAATATGYIVKRFGVVTGAATCLTGDCSSGAGTANAYYDDKAAAGTQFDYAAQAYNKTGFSYDLSAHVRLTQLAPPPVVSIAGYPTLTDDSSDVSIKETADINQDPNNLYCGASACMYELYKNNTSYTHTWHTTTNAVYTWNGLWNASGDTVNYTANTHNAALTNNGWGTMSAAVTVNVYPGTFSYQQWFGDVNKAKDRRYEVSMVNTDTSGTTVAQQAGYTTLSWSASSGADHFEMSRVDYGNDSISTNSALYLPNTATPTWSSGDGGAWHWTVIAAPGATYHHILTAVSQAGLKRSVTTGNYITPADLPHSGQQAVVCSNNTYSDQTTALNDFPDHYIGSRLIYLNHKPLRGNWTNTEFQGFSVPKGGSWQQTNDVTLSPYDSDINIGNGPGMGYYYGINSGFNIWTNGNGGPDSLTFRLNIPVYATFDSGCGAYHATWGGMNEPTYPCYGYVPGTTCSTANLSNRPQWSTK